MKTKGVSAVIGVILMVAITVAIAATVYVYVTSVLEEKATEYTKTGLFLGIVDDDSGNELVFGSIDNVSSIHNLLDVDENYLQNFIGENIVLTYKETQRGKFYTGAYLCPT